MVVQWTEQEPIFQNVVRTEIVVKHPVRRLFRRVEVPVQQTVREQTGTRPVQKQRVDHVGSGTAGLKDIASTGGFGYGLAADQLVTWKLGSSDSHASMIPLPQITEQVAAARGLVVAASREALTVCRGTGMVGTILKEANTLFYAVAVSPNGTRVVAGLGRQAAVLNDAATRRSTARFEGFRRKIQAVAFVGDSRVLVGSDDSTVGLFDIKGTRLATGSDHMLPIVAVAGTSTGDLAASADASGSVHIYTGADLRNRFALQLRDEVRSMEFSPSGHFLAVATSEGPIAIINTRTGRVEARLGSSSHLCSGVAFSDQRELVSSHDNGLMVVWSPDQQRPSIDLAQIQVQTVQNYSTRSSAGATPAVRATAPGRAPNCPNCRSIMVIRRRNSPPHTRVLGLSVVSEMQGHSTSLVAIGR